MKGNYGPAFHKFDEGFIPEKYFIELDNKEKSKNVALKRGVASMKCVDSRDECVDIVFINAFYNAHKCSHISTDIFPTRQC